MQVSLKARNVPVSATLQEHIDSRLGKLNRYLDTLREMQVDLSLQHTRQGDRARVQVTARAEGQLLRAEVDAADFLTAVDGACERMQRQILRYKERVHGPRGRGTALRDSALPEAEEEELEENTGIVRIKRFDAKPMDEEEAIEQMELLGHTFFLFRKTSDERFCVLYKRSGGGYGLLEPVVG